LKCENLLLLVPTVGQRQVQFRQIHELTLGCIVSSKEAFRIHLKVHGVTGSIYNTSGNAFLKTYTAADTGEAVTMLIKADKIRRHFGGSAGPPLGSMKGETTRIIREANEALAEFECGVLSECHVFGVLLPDTPTRGRWQDCVLGCRHAMARVGARVCHPRSCCEACMSMV